MSRYEPDFYAFSPLRCVLELLAFGSLAAIPFFITHQWIAYGGPLNQLYLQAIGAWLETFVIYLLTMLIYLMIWAGLWHGGIEGRRGALGGALGDSRDRAVVARVDRVAIGAEPIFRIRAGPVIRL